MGCTLTILYVSAHIVAILVEPQSDVKNTTKPMIDELITLVSSLLCRISSADVILGVSSALLDY